VQTYSIKRALVATNSLAGEWDWRAGRSEPELTSLIKKFGEWHRPQGPEDATTG
jgi:hypothetical protein